MSQVRTGTRRFVPILLGTEIGAYGMARAFFEGYGVKSVAYGTFPLTPTANSRFIAQRCDERLLEPAVLVETLNRDAVRLAGATGLVIPCGDEYAVLLSRVADQLDGAYVAVCSGPGVLEGLNDKSRFYDLCERAGVPYPRCVTVDEPRIPELPFGYPVAVKPTDAAGYREHHFEGQRKAFVVHDEQVLAETLRRVYASGYEGRLVIQDFVPGGDTDMRVVNGYVRRDGTLALLSLGQPILEDCAPMRIGNYAAIISYGDNAVYDVVERLMAHVSYFGYFNLDLKFDVRDGSYQLLDFNPRQGRSSFFTTLSGHNLARCVVEDVIDGVGGTCVRAREEVLWVGVPRSIVRHYVTDAAARRRAVELMREGKVGTTLFGAHDRDPRRLWAMAKLWAHYHLDFRLYFGKRELEG